MPLVKSAIEADILTLLNQSFDNTTTSTALKNQFADKLSDVIINAIQSATLTIPPSSIVTVGSATTQTNAAPVVVIGGLS